MDYYDNPAQDSPRQEQVFSEPAAQCVNSGTAPRTATAGSPGGGRGCLQMILGFLLAFILMGGLAVFGIAMLGKGCAAAFSSLQSVSESAASGFTAPVNKVSERVLIKGSNPENKRIAVIAVQGVIQFGGKYSQSAVAENIIRELTAAAEDPTVAAVILDMNTPGGEVVASDEILQQVRKCRRAGKPVVTCMRSMAASGGYFIASGSNWIIANRMTFTGSIGVIISSYQISGLLDKIGVEPEVYRSGKMKDMLSPTRPRTHQEKTYVQNLVMETYREFCQVVADGRSRYKNADAVSDSDFGDGRVLSGINALNLGLVDQIGYFDDAVKKARELGKAPDAEVVGFSFSPTMWDFILSMKAAPALQLNGLLGGGIFALEPGRLYFLPAECIKTAN